MPANNRADHVRRASSARRWLRVGAALLALVALALGGHWLMRPVAAPAGAAAAAGPPPVPVVAGNAETRDVAIWLSGIGSVQPLNAVTVKVRVDGQLDRVDFIEGQEVRTGAVLAQIDPRPFQAQLKQAEASKAKDEAQLANARVDLTRFAKLSGMGAAPSQNVDTLKAQVAALEATVEADQAAIDAASLQLGFTTITSPLDGRTGLRLIDPGSIVHPGDANGLVTVTQMQPIAVLFALPQDDLPDVLAAQAAAPVTVAAYTRDGSRSLATGRLVFIDSQVDQATGQVRLKASFDNGDRALWPGSLVTARLLLRTEKGATVVPATAVQRGQAGTYVYAIRPDRTVEARPVSLGPVADGFAIVRSGLSPGEPVVVDGQYRVQPGARVEPTVAAPAAARRG